MIARSFKITTSKECEAVSNVSVDPNWPSSKFHAKLGGALMPVIVAALDDLDWSECEPVLNLACAYLNALAKKQGSETVYLSPDGNVYASIFDENHDEEIVMTPKSTIQKLAADRLDHYAAEVPRELELCRADFIRTFEAAIEFVRSYEPNK